ncbi:hypothetical protein CR513_59094, partial [Mucuna pruriens]
MADRHKADRNIRQSFQDTPPTSQGKEKQTVPIELQTTKIKNVLHNWSINITKNVKFMSNHFYGHPYLKKKRID